ncbi:DUF222 domain-containing protein [Amycolatopsis sp. 195334CR]|uniref:DUF222 domain-containing protein n=1 Tax=Amycolatopsis sp. 195334CR TaxID=2814588 RepID=UPI001A8F7514|nr:DUF222 domain-containing protein [Amycolatopsis sp. 195334CR]MBN6040832.1 DUF222 domain-containing protein [Amycolatopsis sp. 195334CR]
METTTTKPTELHRIVVELQQNEKEVARLHARRMKLVAEFCRRSEARRGLPEQIAMALSMTKHRAAATITAAEKLTAHMPKTFALLEKGSIPLTVAERVRDATSWLPDSKLAEVDSLLENTLEGRNPTQARRITTRTVAKVDQEGHADRAKGSRRGRQVRLRHGDAGTASLAVTSAPIEHALAAYANVDQLARRLKTADETRTLDQLRADTMLDLLMGKQFGGEVRTHCYLYLDATTYAGLNNRPAELAGHGLIPAWLAKEMCSGRNTVFQRIITEPQSGQVTELGEAKHSSTGNVTELVRVRDRECRRPGCTKPAKLTELELCEHHDGRTESAHIGTCAADHKLPAIRGWHHTLEADGSLTVTTPSGETYTSRPEPLHEPRSIQDDSSAGTDHQGHTYCRCA